MQQLMRQSPLLRRIWQYKSVYMILLPVLVFFIIFAYMPMVGIQLAFRDFQAHLGVWGSPFVGLEKFEMLFQTAAFARAIRNTITISVMKIIFGFPIPILLALLINELTNRKLSRVLQTVFTLPHFLSWVVLAGILMNLLGNDGALNNLIALMGSDRRGFLTNPGIFRWLLVVTEIWKSSGWAAIMYLAAIASIDPSLYESAAIDGASRLQMVRFITLPGIKIMALILLILSIGNIMNSNFDQVFNMYNPAVFSTGDVIDTYLFRVTFQQTPDFGFSTAVGVFRGVINFALLLTANFVVVKINKDKLI